MAAASVVIHPYFRTSGYAHIHIPARLARECEIISGNNVSFIARASDGKLIIEQVKEDKNAFLMGTSAAEV
jgi:hypothetical protein